MVASADITALLKVLSDATRLRILGLIEREELSVGELSQALAMGQSRVSNHLRILREAHLVAERHVGKSTFLRLAPGGPAGNGAAAGLELWGALRARFLETPEHGGDLGRLERLLDERQRSERDFFERVADDWDKIGLDFETGQARHRAAAGLLPPGRVLADLGCGTGYMGRALAGLCDRLILVDRSKAMLRRARERLERAPGGTELDFRLGELHRLPIEDALLDGLVAGMVLHHLPHLDGALEEMRRVLKPGAPLTLLDLAPHGEGWLREAQGDRLLGVDPKDVIAGLERQGLVGIALETPSDHYVPTRPPAGEQTGARTNHAAGERARLPLFLIRALAPARANP